MYDAGTIVAGKYRIERQLGSGGMGVVVAATHLQLGTPVALKFLHVDMAQNQSVVERFMREARASAQLRGENVCRVSDTGTANGQPFIVMELLGGQDLGTVLRTSGTLPVASAAEIILQACIALGEAHAVGIVHRDIKPGNLFWTQRPDGSALIKVLDFGVAKAPEEVNFSLTQTSNLIGSPGYMSPEQLKSSKNADARSDIWSLGVVLYELVSGRKPFHGESITELALKVAMDPVPPLGGSVPPTFESVILRCLEKEAHRRFKDVADLAQALAPFVGPVRGAELAYQVSRVLGPRPQYPVHTTTPAHGTSTPTTLRSANGVVTASAPTVRRNWRLPVVMGLGAAVGVLLALLMVTKKKPAAVEPAAAETQKMEVAPTAAPTPSPPANPAEAPAAAAAKPVEAKPVEAKPVEAKPVEAKPVEAKAVEPTPARTETKKPASSKKPVAAKKPASKPVAKPTTKKPPRKPAGDIGDSRL